MFSPFSATHFQKVYFPSTRQTKTEHCLPLYSEYLRVFKGGGGVYSLLGAYYKTSLAIRVGACLRLGAHSNKHSMPVMVFNNLIY